MLAVIVAALIDAIIVFGTGALTLLTAPNVSDLSDVGDLQWVVLSIGAGIGFFKGFQTFWTRTFIGKVTGKEYTPPTPPETQG